MKIRFSLGIKFFLFIISIVISLLLFEGIVRWSGFGHSLGRFEEEMDDIKERGDISAFYQYHSIVGWVNKPNVELTLAMPDSRTQVKINSKGLRDKEYDYGRSNGKKRILVLGDSLAWGYGVEQEETFSERLEELLQPDVEVINAGVFGYGTDQAMLYYKNEGYKYQPDLLLVLFLENDLVDNTKNTRHGFPKPKFVLNDGKLELTHVPVPQKPIPSPSGTFAGKPQLQINVSSLKKFFATHSMAYLYVTTTLKSQPVISDFLYSHGMIKSPGLDITQAIIAEFHRTVKSQNAQLVFIFPPYDRSFHTGALPYSCRKIMEFCQKEGIDCLDAVRPLYQYQLQSKKVLWFRHDPHPTKEGHQALASLVAGYLKQHVKPFH